MRALLLPLLLALSACQRPTFTCTRNEQCDAESKGSCDVPTSTCAYADPSCDSGLRHGAFSAAASGTCAGGPAEGVAVAWRQPEPVTVDADLRELRRGPGLALDSEFGVSGRVWLSYDDDAFYVGADVVDPSVESAEREGTLPWHVDGLELMLDTAHDRASGRIPHSDDFKFVVTAINEVETSWGGVIPTEVWDTTVQSATRTDGTLNQASDQDRGYTVEVAIPWNKDLRRPNPGDAWGFNIKLNDQRGANGRRVTWRDDGPFNHPSTAGVLVFSDGDEIVVPEPSPAPPPTPKYERLELGALLDKVEPAELRAGQPATNVFDGCTAHRSECMAATEKGEFITLEFDLGQTHELGFARVFSDDRGEQVTQRWALWTADQSDGGEWNRQFLADANGAGWHTRDLRGLQARRVRVQIAGLTGTGVEFVELELYARPVSPDGPSGRGSG